MKGREKYWSCCKSSRRVQGSIIVGREGSRRGGRSIEVVLKVVEGVREV